MKWSEFKKQVDDKLKELGVDDPDINYIEISTMYPGQDIELLIGMGEHNDELEIS